MVKSSKLSKFSVEPEGSDFVFRIEDDGGRSFVLTASRDQLDVIAETLDELLLADEAGDEVTDDPDEEDFDDEALDGEDLDDDDPGGDGFEDGDSDDDDAGDDDDAEDAAPEQKKRSLP